MPTLKEFLKEQAEFQRLHGPEREAQLREWLGDVHRLLRQIEGWIREADDEHVLWVGSDRDVRREALFGTYDVETLVIRLGGREVRVVPVARGVVPLPRDLAESIPGLDVRATGRVDMTDGAHKFMLYRTASDADELRWIIIDEDGYRAKPLGRESFQAALLDLLK